MSTYTQILYQLVFSTRGREQTMTAEGQEQLYRIIWGVLNNHKCHSYRINGTTDHLHIITHVHPMVAVSALIKDIKLGSSDAIFAQKIFPHFKGWQEGFGAFTYSISAKNDLIDYVKNQKVHHQQIGFREEYIRLLKQHQVEFDERYLM